MGDKQKGVWEVSRKREEWKRTRRGLGGKERGMRIKGEGKMETDKDWEGSRSESDFRKEEKGRQKEEEGGGGGRITQQRTDKMYLFHHTKSETCLLADIQ